MDIMYPLNVEVGRLHLIDNVRRIGFSLFDHRKDTKFQHSFPHLAGCVVDVHGFNVLTPLQPSRFFREAVAKFFAKKNYSWLYFLKAVVWGSGWKKSGTFFTYFFLYFPLSDTKIIIF